MLFSWNALSLNDNHDRIIYLCIPRTGVARLPSSECWSEDDVGVEFVLEKFVDDDKLFVEFGEDEDVEVKLDLMSAEIWKNDFCCYWLYR